MFSPEKNHGHVETESLLDEAWEKSERNLVVESLKAGRNLQEILTDLPGFVEAFSHRLDVLDCSDGRVCSGHKLGLAGVGILLSTEERTILASAIKERGLTVTGHDNCGAAGLAHPGDPESDKYGYENAKALAAETGSTYGEVHKEDFVSPVHNERALVVEETGRFDCANWPEFPSQFISSAPAFNLPDSYLTKEIAALTNIALGDHGFGDRFTAENPFYIFVSASNDEKLSHLKEVAAEATKVFGERVKVDGFVAPLSERQ